MQVPVEMAGEIGVAVCNSRVCAIEGIDQGLRVVEEEVLEELAQMDG
jgi:NADH:ubiquinone oxidoreductase subunit E